MVNNLTSIDKGNATVSEAVKSTLKMEGGVKSVAIVGLRNDGTFFCRSSHLTAQELCFMVRVFSNWADNCIDMDEDEM